jgi:hypothetical protein
MVGMNQSATPQVQDGWSDPRVDRKFRTFPRELKKDSTSFLELPQPKAQDRVAELQNKTLVDMSRINAGERTQDGRTLNLSIMARPPPGARANPLALWRQRDLPLLSSQAVSPLYCIT